MNGMARGCLPERCPRRRPCRASGQYTGPAPLVAYYCNIYLFFITYTMNHAFAQAFDAYALPKQVACHVPWCQTAVRLLGSNYMETSDHAKNGAHPNARRGEKLTAHPHEKVFD